MLGWIFEEVKGGIETGVACRDGGRADILFLFYSLLTPSNQRAAEYGTGP